jgi:hypothetical protein
MGNLFPNPIYVDDILLVSSDVNLLLEKKFLSSRFNKNILGEMFLIIRIEIHQDRRKGVLELSIGMLRKVSKKIKYLCGKPTPVPMVKGVLETLVFQKSI